MYMLQTGARPSMKPATAPVHVPMQVAHWFRSLRLLRVRHPQMRLRLLMFSRSQLLKASTTQPRTR